MIDLLDTLNNDSDIVYKKCGEIVVAPKRNVFALYCIFCEDIFVHVQEFIRHAKRMHDDEFEFGNNDEQDIDIFSIEELMDGMSNNEIIAQENMEWARRKRNKNVFENRVPKFEDEIRSAVEFSDMEYWENEGNPVELGKVDELRSPGMVQSKEVCSVVFNELESKKQIQYKNDSSAEEDNPDLDDLLEELDDLDCLDISIIKNLGHKTDKSLPQTETNIEKVCNRNDSIYQYKKSAEKVVDNNLKSNFENFELIEDKTNNKSTGYSKICVEKKELSSETLNPREISKTHDIKNTAQINFTRLPKSEYYNDPISTEGPYVNIFHEVNEHNHLNSTKHTFNKTYISPRLDCRKDYITKEEQHLTSVDSVNYELLDKESLKDITITKLKTTYMEVNKKEPKTPTSTHENDTSDKTLIDEKQFNKMLKVRIKKISPSLSAEESPEMDQNQSSKKMPNENMLTNFKSNKRRSIRIKENYPSIQPISDKKSESPLAGNKATFPKTDYVAMEPASPMKNIFCKQNFTEQSVNEKVLKRNNGPIEPQSKIKQLNFKPFAMPRQRKASIDVLQQTPINNHNPELNRTARKKQVLERMSQIRKRITKIIDKENVVGLQPEKKNYVEITDVTILPNMQSINSKNRATHQLFDAFIKPSVKAKEDTKIPAFNMVSKKKTNSFVDPLKLNRSSPNQMYEHSGVVSSDLTKLDLSESVVEFLEDDLYQNKLDINQLDSILETAPIETEYNTDANISARNKDSSSSTLILEELLDQVDKETKAKESSIESNRTIKKEPLHKFHSENPKASGSGKLNTQNVSSDKETKVKEFSELSNRTIKKEPLHKLHSENPKASGSGKLNTQNVSSDGYITIHEESDLLSKIGLTILKSPQYEILPIRGEELLRFKAKLFADILRSMPSIWQPRRLKDAHTEQLNSSFLEMTAKINIAFKANFTSIEAKRIFNLVMSWYTKQSNAKWQDKKAIPTTLQYYMQLFSFLPKTARPIYNCEFCDQQYRSEAAYSIHRCTHTGGLAYSCFHCGKGFMKSSSHKIHERSHLQKNNEIKNQSATKTEKNVDLKASPKKNFENNKTYLKRIHSPENITEYNSPKRFQEDKSKSDLSTITLQNANELHSNKIVLKKVLPTVKEMSNHMFKKCLKTK